METTYQLIERVPTLEEYRMVCTGVGWGKFMNFDVSATALQNSLYCVVIEDGNGEIVGMGRVVGDGAMYFYIQDIAVLPSHQGRGVGSMIMRSLMRYINSHAPSSAYIGLFTNGTKTEYYRQYGFVESIGMFQYKTDE